MQQQGERQGERSDIPGIAEQETANGGDEAEEAGLEGDLLLGDDIAVAVDGALGLALLLVVLIVAFEESHDVLRI